MLYFLSIPFIFSRFWPPSHFQSFLIPPDTSNPMQEARACYSFRDSGKCTYGDACKFSHLGESKTQVKTQVEGTTIGNSPTNTTTTSTSPTQKKNYPNRTPKVKQQKLFITGLPRYSTARRWKNRIEQGFNASGIAVGKIRLGVNSFGHLKGFFHLGVEHNKVDQILATPVQVHDEVADITYPLTISKSVPGKIEMLFPSLTCQQRTELKFDPTGIFSCTDEFTGDLTTRLSRAFCEIGNGKAASYSVLDMFGCVGGNTISFAKQFQAVTSVELNETRAEMLQHNVNVVGVNVNCVQGDGILAATSAYHSVVWLDPPWGGVEYTKHKQALIEDFDIVSNETTLTMRQVIQAVAPHTDMIAYRLPNNFDIDKLLEWFVDPATGLCGDLGANDENNNNDRPLPFRIRMGHKCTLLLIGLPASRTNRRPIKDKAGDEGRLSFGLHALDALIATLHAIDKELLKELHPKFYDWEQKRGIRLKNWKGVSHV
jgi:16S rRNA G966 N2-methylase RsmD